MPRIEKENSNVSESTRQSSSFSSKLIFVKGSSYHYWKQEGYSWRDLEFR